MVGKAHITITAIKRFCTTFGRVSDVWNISVYPKISNAITNGIQRIALKERMKFMTVSVNIKSDILYTVWSR